MRNLHMRSTAAILLAICLLGSGARALADDDETQTETKGTTGDTNETGDNLRHPLSSTKDDSEKNAATKFGSPHGPAMDGIRGSAVPAPGAFGTDAHSPDDLRR